MAEGGETSETLSKETADEQQGHDEFSKIVKDGFAALMPTIRASNSLPKGPQWDLFCTSPSFKPIMDSLGNKALELMALILNHQGIYRDIRKRDLEERYELIVEANDKILERVGLHLDELSGIRRNPSDTVADIPVSEVSKASGSWNKNVSQSAAWKEVRLSKTMEMPVILKSARVTLRPQVKFHDKIDNRSIPFEPRIKEKPNALKPLAILYEDVPDEDACYSHPYEFELSRFQERIEKLNLEKRKPREPRPVDETPLLWVNTEDQLEELLQDLRRQTEFAVDLEHHSYRSFQGFTCLIQISTREKDYIVDTLELRHKLHILNEVFTDPKIVKVFHGADSDIPWLQRDFSLYVVNMFDTYQAALLLSLPRLSLAFLLKMFCNVDANKCFQLYDWRTRPLAKEAIKYAREDTHYLLYIFDMLWNKLLEKSKGGTNLLQSALFRSADTCKKRYWKSIYKEDSYEGIYRQSKKNFDNRQLYALKELHAWRDRTAREEDESVGYVLPNHMLLLIAETLPREMQGILACCNPIPPLVRQNLVLLHQMILKAREQPLVVRMTPVNNDARVRPTQQTSMNMEGALHCPHDLTHNMDFRDNLPTLLDDNHNAVACRTDLVADTSSVVQIFGETYVEEESNVSRMSLPNQIHFMSPFDRYKKMLSYLEEEEKKTEEEKQEEIQRNTQKLLDECMRERLKAAAAQVSGRFSTVIGHVKEENEPKNPRKRDRSQDSTLNDSLDSKLNVSVKSESSTEDTTNHSARKKNNINKNDSELVTNLSFVSVESIKSEEGEEDNPSPRKRRKHKIKHNTFADDEDKSSYESNKQKLAHKPKEIPIVEMDDEEEVKCLSLKKKKKKRKLEYMDNTSEEILNNTSSGKKQLIEKQSVGKKSSENFTPYDYSQVDYDQYQRSENSQTQRNTPGKFKHKGKKKQQNKMFTFQRQYGSGGSSSSKQ